MGRRGGLRGRRKTQAPADEQIVPEAQPHGTGGSVGCLLKREHNGRCYRIADKTMLDEWKQAL